MCYITDICPVKYALTKVDKSSQFENLPKNYSQRLTLFTLYIYILFLDKK